MAKQTGAELATYVKNVFNRTDKDDELFEAATDTLIDMRLRLLSENFKEEAYTTGIATLGDFQLGLPSDFGHIIGDITGLEDDVETWSIKKIDKQTFDQEYGARLHTTVANRETGKPRHFCIYAKQIYLGVVPDSISYQYQINYTTEPETAIVTGTSAVDFTDRHREVVRYGILFRLHKLLENDVEADRNELDYEKGLQKILDNNEFNTETVEHVEYHGI